MRSFGLLLLLAPACATDVIDHAMIPEEICSASRVFEQTTEDDDLVIQTVSEYGLTPIEGVSVEVVGMGVVGTNAEGNATFGFAAAPYTIRVHQISSGSSSRGPYRFDDFWVIGQITGNRVVLCVDGSTVPLRSSTITGAVSGAAAGSRVSVFALNQGIGERAAEPVEAESSGAFEAGSQWEGVSRDLVLRALESDAATPPAHYLGYATAPATVTDPNATGGDLTGVNLALAPVGEGHASGQITTTLESIDASLLLDFPDSTLLIDGGTLDGPSPAFDYVLPDIEGSRARIRFSAQDDEGTYRERIQIVGVPSSGAAFELPEPVELLSPTEGATIAPDSAAFSWSSGPAGVTYGLRFACQWEAGGTRRNVNYRSIQTTATQVALPSLPNTEISAGARCDWDVSWSRVDEDGEEYAASRTRTAFTE